MMLLEVEVGEMESQEMEVEEARQVISILLVVVL
jgi:hypothetical protein